MKAYYRDLREYLAYLESVGKLRRIKIPINKDTELMPLVRWQFRGLPEEERTGFLFENVYDSRGRTFGIPVAVATHAPSTEVYAMAMGCRPEEIQEKWSRAISNPIPPVLVQTGPVHEVVQMSEGKTEEGMGLDALPIPISTPGFDPSPYLTSTNWVTKDPETGIRNVGNYRAQLKGSWKTGVVVVPVQHIGIHFSKAKALGKPLEAALVVGASPCVGLSAVNKIPYGLDEFSVAGGIAGAPLELVKCKTVDIEVPASAEIVMEGHISTKYREMEAPFGEFTGYMGRRTLNAYFEISCMTHRRNPIYHALISQFPPSESSKMRQIGYEGVYYKFLKFDCSISGVLKVVFFESGGSWEYCVIQMRKTHPAQAWQVLKAASALDPTVGKIIIVVDEDIDPRDPDAVNWALSFRMQPQRDILMCGGRISPIDPSASPPETPHEISAYPPPTGNSAMLIDATRKWAYSPTSLPKKEYMERARQLWDELRLPQLHPKEPWHGYSLGDWDKENEEEALLATQGDYYKTAEKLAKTKVRWS